MANLIMRKNNRFVVNKDYIKSGVNKDKVCTALYAEIYLEFRGANEHKEYSKLTHIERIKAVNNFAKNWLKQEGCYNEEAEK